MTPIQYFYSAHKAISRLKKSNASVKNKVHYVIKLIEASHTIVTEGYDKLFDELFSDGISAAPTTKRLEFCGMSPTYWKNATAIKTVSTYHKETPALKFAEKQFGGCASKAEEKRVAKKYRVIH